MRKTSAALLLSLTLAVSGFSVFTPRAARAQLVVSDPVVGANTTIQTTGDFLDKVLLGGVTMSFINAMNYFAQKLAYDAAVFIAAGGKGEGPLFEYKSFGSYLGDVALGAAGEAIGTFSDIGFLGFNLCEPTGPGAPQISLALQLGIAAQYQAPVPRCEWNRIADSWDQFTTSFETGEVLRNIQLSIGPGQTGLHAFFQAPLRVADEVALQEEAAARDREEGAGFRSVTDVVTGRLRTPAAVVRETALEETARLPGKQQGSTAAIIGPVISQGVLQVLSVALGTFVNTLASQLLNKAFEEGSFDVTGFDLACEFRDAVPGSADALRGLHCPPDPSDAEGAARGGKAAARAAYASLLAPRVQEVNNYDAVAEFTVCPDAFRGPQNCAMDPGFAAAVRVALQGAPLTVREAVAQGYLHADWPLVPETGEGASRNADPFCFNNAYCHSNLVKLRKARIIPIGFELAAENADAETTLGDVLDAFNKCGDPNPNVSKFCGLVDPDWLLKYPLTQCRAKVFGPTVLAADSDIRGETCVDAPTCIAENPDGTCGTGYGYCTREKNVWRLGGDACPAQFASCQTFAGPNGRDLSVLKNTVDKGICSTENAGCNWYATQQDPGNGLGDWQHGQGRLFLDRDGGACTQQNAGCSELIARAGVRANLVRNPSFELNGQTATRPDAWNGTVTAYPLDIGAAHGSAAVSSAVGIFQRIGVDPGQAYTLSGYARRAAGDDGGSVRLQLAVADAAGAPVRVASGDTTCDLGLGGTIQTLVIGPDSDIGFTRNDCTFTVPSGGALLTLTVTSDGGALADALQFEYGASATAFRAAAYQGEQRAYLKQPPAWLGCTGEAGDPPECAQYAGVCRPDEVGCDAYAPETGGMPVPGIVADENRCDAACVGYAAYKEEASTLSFARYPVHLIPRRGRTCSVASAGCTEFTNLDAAAAGGEAREYYSALRACEKPRPGETMPVYYTWEGSDTTGFQLKEWLLKADTAAPGRPPALVSPAFAAGCTSDIYLAGGNPDCREFFDAAGTVSYRLYSKTIVISPDCRPLRMTELPVDDAVTDAGACAARGGRFLDGRCSICTGIGGVWNDPSGADLGCTFNAFAPESRSCTAAESGCRLYTGNAGANVRSEGFWDFEGGNRDGWGPDADTSVSTESTAVGGHSIRVAAGGTLARSVADAPEVTQGSTYYLTFWAKGRGALTARFSGAPAARAFTAGGITLGSSWNRYSLGPVLVDWTPAADEALVLSGFGDTSFVDRIELTRVASNIALVKDSWTIPAICDENAAGAFLPQAQLGCSAYRAERSGATEYLTGFASLCREKAVGCTAFVATRESPSPGRESWNALCVLPIPATAGPLPCSVGGREVCTVGVNRRSCRYQTDDVPAPVSFDVPAAGVCQVDGIVIVDGTGTPVRRGGPGACIGQPTDLVVVPADAVAYLVDDGANRCEPQFAGCTLVGRSDGRVCTLASACAPGPGRDDCDCFEGAGAARELLCQVEEGETACRAPLPFREPFASTTRINYAETAVLNDPTQYGASLCSVEAAGCQEWTEVGPATGKAYFKDPETRTCAYREDVSVDGRSFDGWFRTGTDIPCDRALLVSGETYGIWKNGDEQYRGFVGSCPATASTCTEFLDPADRDTRHPLGRPYTFLKNNKIDARTCGGQVNPLNGCVLFNDATDPNLTANTLVTNSESARRGNASVSPVSCAGGTCGQCLYQRPQARCADFRWGLGSCTADADCAAEAGTAETGTCILQDASGGPERPSATAEVYAADGTLICTDRFLNVAGDAVPLPSFRALYRGGSNDANVVLNVARDRVCGEWLACQSSTPVWDPTRNRFIEICDAIGRCNEYQKNGDSAVCVSWVSREPQVLTEEAYRGRVTSYAGQDYAGYSIPHLFDVESLRQIPVGRFCTGDAARSCTGDADCAPGAGACSGSMEFRLARVIASCTSGAADGSPCTSPEFPVRGQGRCWQGLCAQAPSGSPIETDTVGRDQPQPLVARGSQQNAEAPACRAYPERSAPFPNAVVTAWDPAASDRMSLVRALPKSVKAGFARATLCELGEECECTYTKYEYDGAQVAYAGADSQAPFSAAGICQGGSRNKQPCIPDDTASGCGEGGSCQKLARVTVAQGLFGYCLERDRGFAINGAQETSFAEPGRACITWLPVDRLSGAVDVYNNYGNAGFNIASAAYCAVPEVYQSVRVYGDGKEQPRNDVSVRYAGSDAAFPITMSCGEQDGDSRENYLVDDAGRTRVTHDDGADGLEDDDFDESIPDVDCPGNAGFIVISPKVKDAAGAFGCSEGGDDDFQYFCVPINSRHMADPDKSFCAPHPDLVHARRENDANRLTSKYGAQFYVVGARESEGKHLQKNASLVRPSSWGQLESDGTTSGVEVGSAIAYYADCVATDTPIAGGPNSPGTPYFGCQTAVEVSSGGSGGTNKVLTGRIGNGRIPPPGAPYNIVDPNEDLQYLWNQDADDIEPYGRAITADIDRFTADNGEASPLEIRTCQSGDAYVLPNALNACAAPRTSFSERSETRPYAAITAGPEGGGCSLGADGDLECSRTAPGSTGTPSCTKNSGTIRGCFKKCSSDADCGGGLGTCEEHDALHINLCSSGLPGDWSTDISSCESDSNRVLVGACSSAGSKTGSACRTDGDCAAVRCVRASGSASRGVCEGRVGRSGDSVACQGGDGPFCRDYGGDYSGRLTTVVGRLQQLFAATYGLFVYRPQDNGANKPADYVPFTLIPGGINYDPAALSYDISNTIGRPPVVRAVGSCTTQSQCLEGPEGQVSVNGVDGGQVKGGNGTKNVTLRFFAYAQNDQMPIRKVTVDWGDGSNPSGNNPGSSFKNRRGFRYERVVGADGTESLELVSLCDNHDFGTSADACDSIAPFAFNHAYICTRDATAPCFDGTDDCVQTVDGRPACVYKPRVQVLDNWGFCNGSCAGGAPTTDTNFCYDASTNPSLAATTINECLIPNNPTDAAFARARGINPFTEFAGDVVVFPRE